MFGKPLKKRDPLPAELGIRPMRELLSAEDEIVRRLERATPGSVILVDDWMTEQSLQQAYAKFRAAPSWDRMIHDAAMRRVKARVDAERRRAMADEGME